MVVLVLPIADDDTGMGQGPEQIDSTIRRLGYLQCSADIRYVLALGQQPISLGQLPHNLLRGVPF